MPIPFFTRLRRALIGTRGAIDLASIMVGVIIVGVLAGVIAASVFVVIPWAQENAAKQSLDAVVTAQGVHRAQDGVYANSAGLKTKKLLEHGTDIKVVTGADGKCWVAAVEGANGVTYYLTSKSQKVLDNKAGTPDTSWCAPAPTFGSSTVPLGLDALGVMTTSPFMFAVWSGAPHASERFPWATGASRMATEVKDVRAWIDGSEITISTDGWMAQYDGDAGAAMLMRMNAPTIGDGTPAAFEAFLDRGTVSATIDDVKGNVVSVPSRLDFRVWRAGAAVDSAGVQIDISHVSRSRLHAPWLDSVFDVELAKAESVSGVTATVNGAPVAVSGTWFADWRNPMRLIGIWTIDGRIGDNSEATLAAFRANGTITMTIDGIPGNTFTVKDGREN